MERPAGSTGIPTATPSPGSPANGSAAAAGVKRLIVAPIHRTEAVALVVRNHYSRGYARNSMLHLGVFDGPRLVGALQFGPPICRRNMLGLVPGTPWNDMLELNRMVLENDVPRNAESRVIAAACRLLRRHAPHVKWVLSFADAGQCGDGTIYRAAGFQLTGIRWTEFLRMPSGRMVHKLCVSANAPHALGGAASVPEFARRSGAQRVRLPSVRYVKILDSRFKLRDPPLPYAAIAEAGASCYRGVRGSAPGTSPRAGSALVSRRPTRPEGAVRSRPPRFRSDPSRARKEAGERRSNQKGARS